VLLLIPRDQVLAESAPPIHVQASDLDEGGRGLFLVRALSEELGYYPSAAGSKVTRTGVTGGQTDGQNDTYRDQTATFDIRRV
jgi:hypothetical protein